MLASPTLQLPSGLSLAFIGGGNMAGAIIGGLLRQGLPASAIQVIEPLEAQRHKLEQQFAIHAQAHAEPQLAQAGLVIWAIKPQTFHEAATQAQPYLSGQLHLSVAAGIRSDSIARWLGSERIVRSMPNTPALVGRGMTALFARAGAQPVDRQLAETVVATTGESLWVEREEQLDAVTALSGSGPAYVFFFLEAMAQAGAEMGLPAEQALRLAINTFGGAAELARASGEAPALLRERVTSKGGTTHAAITSMQADGMAPLFIKALHAACRRAAELGDEFGAA